MSQQRRSQLGREAKLCGKRGRTHRGKQRQTQRRLGHDGRPTAARQRDTIMTTRQPLLWLYLASPVLALSGVPVASWASACSPVGHTLVVRLARRGVKARRWQCALGSRCADVAAFLCSAGTLLRFRRAGVAGVALQRSPRGCSQQRRHDSHVASAASQEAGLGLSGRAAPLKDGQARLTRISRRFGRGWTREDT